MDDQVETFQVLIDSKIIMEVLNTEADIVLKK